MYLVWLVLVVAMYPVGRWYAEYKQRHAGRWWLAYV